MAATVLAGHIDVPAGLEAGQVEAVRHRAARRARGPPVDGHADLGMRELREHARDREAFSVGVPAVAVVVAALVVGLDQREAA